MFNTYLSRLKCYRKFARKSLVFLLTFSLLVSQFSFLIPSVYAASSPWSQTDWSGGSGQTSWSDTTKFDSSSSVTTSTAGQATLTATSSWYNTSWAYRRKVTFDNSSQAENLTNFPVLVKLSSSNINYSSTQDSGQDIRFTDSDGTTLLKHEIEKWDETGNSFVWVKVPQIDSSSNTDHIYMYYGNSGATDGQDAANVWESNYKAVYHLKETGNGTSGEYKDSTSPANNGQGGGGTAANVPGQTSSGQIDGAGAFDATNDFIDLASATLLTAGQPYTISWWERVKSGGSSFPARFRLPVSGGTNGFLVLRNDDSLSYRHLAFGIMNGHVAIIFSTVPTLASSVDTWRHWVITGTDPTSSTTTNHTVYVDGVNYTTSAQYDFVVENNTTAQIGWDSIDHGANADMDEVHIYNGSLSAPYIAAQYKSEADTFNTYASEEPQVQTSGTLTSSIFDTEFSSGAAWGSLTYSATTPSNTSVSVKARTSNSSSMTGATAFASCVAITSGSDISSNSCVTDSHRYIQYQLSLANTDSVSTPTFQDVSIAFSAYDADAPSISLTALSPDPNSDNTPTLSGTATESIGTVSNVQFQMDSTSGSWSTCSSDDASFDEATETFTCTPSALSDGSHTMYIRATDSNSNTTTSGSESSDTFTIDATAPTSIDLDSPGDNSYTSSERPTFKWKATSDATAGLWKYTLEIDNPSTGSNQPSGDFTIDSIPTSRTTDYETNKYYIHYENFSDSDSNNNYISVYTKSHNGWSSSENDGKLREGKVSWKVKAVDNAGNETTSSRTLFVDRTGPTVEFTQINDLPSTSKESSSATLEVFFTLSTTDKTPTIYGKITDSLAGGDSSLTQDENGPKVASGPKSVEIKIEKQENLTYKTHTLYTINLDKPYYTCDNKELSDNSKQKCDKYLPFEYTPGQELDLGTYKITVTGKDKAGNTSSDTKFTLNITTLAQITTPEEEQLIEEVLKELPKELQEEVLKRLEITKVEESKPPSALEETVEKVATGGKSVFDSVTSLVGGFVGNIAGGINHGIQQVFNTANAAGQEAKLVFNTVSQVLITISDKTGEAIISLNQKIGEETKTLEERYDHLTNNASGITKIILTKIGNGVSATGSAIASTTNRAILTTATLAQEAGLAMANTVQSAANKVKNRVANIAFTIGEKTQGVTGDFSLALIRFAYNFVPEPTKISDVQILILSPSSAKVSWKTNHPANGKVNWGLTADYGQDVQSEKRVTYHEFTINNLEPNTTYYYEVMSHNKNYVYDANHTFTTPK